MKKITTVMLLILSVVTLSGCKSQNKEKLKLELNIADVKECTMLVKEDGVIQVADIEEFNESYLEEAGLREFIEGELEAYNETKEEEEAIILDSMEVKDGVAKAILNYPDMDAYTMFTGAEASYYTELTEDDLASLPKELYDVELDENVPVDELLQEEDLQVIRVSDEYDLIVGNKIKYYSNGALVNDTTIKTSKDGVTIVAY